MGIKSSFCAKCGKETDLVVEGRCGDCYLGDATIYVPSKVELRICPKCKSINWQNIWAKPPYENEFYFKNYLMNKIKIPDAIEFRDLEADLVNDRAVLLLGIAGREIRREYPVEFKVNKFACPDCSRQFGINWLAKIQVRAEEDIGSIRDKVLNYANRYQDKILKIEDQKNGTDILFYDKSVAKNLAQLLKNKLHLKMKRTAEDQRVRSGQVYQRDVILLKK